MSHVVCAEAQSLCSVLSEASFAGLSLDLSPELTRAVTNVVCSLCFSSSYHRGDPEFEAMLSYSQGIVDTVAKDSLVDIFPWLQVDNTCTLNTGNEKTQEDKGDIQEQNYRCIKSI